MKKWLLLLFLAPAALCASAQDYVFNRYPLESVPYAELPLGAIRPDGWLRGQLERMRDGLTGHLDEVYAEVVGDDNAWLGGEGDTWERGPYWIDGLSEAQKENTWIQRINYDPETEEKYNKNELERLGAYKNYKWLQKPMIWAEDYGKVTSLTGK